jgi:hypothetical protein
VRGVPRATVGLGDVVDALESVEAIGVSEAVAAPGHADSSGCPIRKSDGA